MKTPISQILSTAAALALLATGAIAQTVVKESSSSTTSVGTISEFSPDTIVIRSETSPEPIRYSYSKTTTYVDDAGAPVSMDIVKSGLPVTVYYVKEGDRMVASKVIVKRTKTHSSGGTAVEERKTTKSAAPAIEEKSSSTTTTTETK